MLDEHKNVTEASAEVGYESLSQFIRDDRKMFGAPPQRALPSWRSRRTTRDHAGGRRVSPVCERRDRRGIGGGTEAQDCEIAEYVVSVFERLTA